MTERGVSRLVSGETVLSGERFSLYLAHGRADVAPPRRRRRPVQATQHTPPPHSVAQASESFRGPCDRTGLLSLRCGRAVCGASASGS